MQSDSKPSHPIDLDPLVYPKEKVYFAVCVIVSVAIYAALAMIIGPEMGGAVPVG